MEHRIIYLLIACSLLEQISLFPPPRACAAWRGNVSTRVFLSVC